MIHWITNRTKTNCYIGMIKNLIDLLQEKDFYKVSKDVDIAKGKYQIPRSWSGLKNLFRRI